MKISFNLKIGSIALLSLGMSITAWSQTALPISNASFEAPVLADGLFDQNIDNWSVVGTPSFSGALNPTTADYPGEAPEGSNLAFVTATADGDGLSQILIDPEAVLKAGTEYTLTAQVGNPNSNLFEGYRVQLLANGVLLAEDDNSQSPADGTFATSTVSYTYDAGLHEALLGEPLEIRLLSKALASGETDFDDIQLTVAFVDPVANAGGPYSVAPGDTLALDASASVASIGATITNYDWDLDNDGTFGDVTAVAPTPITFADLQDIWGMKIGENTVQLRVTDSETKTATISASVQLLAAVPTPGFDFYVNAAEADDTSEYWNDLVDGNPSGLGLILDKSVDFGVTRQALATTGTFLTHAFQFPGGQTGNIGGAEVVTSGTVTRQSFQQVGWDTQPVTFEIWIKPDNLTPTPSNGQIIFEDGGGTGLGLFLSNNQILARKAGGSGLVSYDISTDPEGLLRGPATEEFLQAVFTFDTGTGVLQLFINGVFVGSDDPGGSDWTGGDNAAFGTRGQSNVGGIGSGQANTESFAGQMAVIRAYNNQILTPEEVETNFLALAGPDSIPPEIASLNPESGATEVYPGIDQLVLGFNEDIFLTGAGSVTIKNLTAGTDELITLPDASVASAGRELRINPPVNLAFNSQFAVQISSDAVRDVGTNLFAGINDDTTWTFTTAEENLNAPVITVKSPEHEGSAAGTLVSISATFDQNLVLGTGDVVIKDMQDGSSTQTIPVTDETQVTLTDNVLTINPTTFLEGGRLYAVLIPSSAAKNYSDVEITGSTSDTEWTFTVPALSSQLGILDITANGGINPKTGQAWAIGDRYNLLFVSAGTRDALSADIADYNAFVQAEANAQAGSFANMASANWFALGSTTSTDAADNVTIYGPVINLFDQVTIAVDATDFWDFQFTEARTDLEGNLRDVWTGTTTEGVADSNDELGAANGNSRIHWTGWTDWGAANRNEPSDSLQHIMGISEPLFVYDTLDAINPLLVSIADDVAGDPVALDDTPVITYTVTFDEALLPSTVTVDDFSNAGTAAATIDSVVQQEDGAVFLITVTPTAEGTLQLQINQSAALTDLNGNPLDTSLALVDDTIITVEAATAAGYSVWADSFPALADPDPALDFDNGGLATSLEWVLGGDPTNASDDVNIAPTIDNTNDPDGKLLFTFRRSVAAQEDPETAITVEYGSDLTGWTAAAHQGEQPGDITVSVVTDGFAEGIDAVTVALPPALATDDKLFVRLNVDVPTAPVE